KDWISNVPLRGYRFNASVLRERIVDPARPRTEASGSFNKLPVRLTEVIGRDAEIEGVLASLVSHRLVTIVGPGGIGKTSVAICAAERYQQKPGARIAFVDLAPLISPDHVLSTMALSLGVAADLP